MSPGRDGSPSGPILPCSRAELGRGSPRFLFVRVETWRPGRKLPRAATGIWDRSESRLYLGTPPLRGEETPCPGTDVAVHYRRPYAVRCRHPPHRPRPRRPPRRPRRRFRAPAKTACSRLPPPSAGASGGAPLRGATGCAAGPTSSSAAFCAVRAAFLRGRTSCRCSSACWRASPSSTARSWRRKSTPASASCATITPRPSTPRCARSSARRSTSSPTSTRPPPSSTPSSPLTARSSWASSSGTSSAAPGSRAIRSSRSTSSWPASA